MPASPTATTGSGRARSSTPCCSPRSRAAGPPRAAWRSSAATAGTRSSAGAAAPVGHRVLRCPDGPHRLPAQGAGAAPGTLIAVLDALLDACRDAGLLHLAARVDVADLDAVHALEAAGFRLMDALVTYFTHPHREPPPEVREVGRFARMRRRTSIRCSTSRPRPIAGSAGGFNSTRTCRRHGWTRSTWNGPGSAAPASWPTASSWPMTERARARVGEHPSRRAGEHRRRTGAVGRQPRRLPSRHAGCAPG